MCEVATDVLVLVLLAHVLCRSQYDDVYYSPLNGVKTTMGSDSIVCPSLVIHHFVNGFVFELAKTVFSDQSQPWANVETTALKNQKKPLRHVLIERKHREATKMKV